MLIMLFWMVATLQVGMSIVVHVKCFSKANSASLSLKAGQQKDDILACVAMGMALASQYTKAIEIIYCLAIFLIVWLGRRARARFELVLRR